LGFSLCISFILSTKLSNLGSISILDHSSNKLVKNSLSYSKSSLKVLFRSELGIRIHSFSSIISFIFSILSNLFNSLSNKSSKFGNHPFLITGTPPRISKYFKTLSIETIIAVRVFLNAKIELSNLETNSLLIKNGIFFCLHSKRAYSYHKVSSIFS